MSADACARCSGRGYHAALTSSASLRIELLLLIELLVIVLVIVGILAGRNRW